LKKYYLFSYSDYRKDKVWQALERIANRRGIKIVVGNFKKHRDTILGFCVNEGFTVLINEPVPNFYKPSVLAHELAHCQLHGDLDMDAYISDSELQNAVEQEAEGFAKRLLRFVKSRLPKPQPPPGYKSINTAEGWNELARRTREKQAMEAAA
jgi:Zn-dependent peptidase ImmA (M78 family)